MIRNFDPDKKPALRALIVGASGGIGLAIARALIAKGIQCILHGRNKTKLDDLQSNLRRDGFAVETLCLEISSTCDHSELAAVACRVDMLVFAYGSFLYKTLAQTDDSDWNETVYANLTLPGFIASQAAVAMAGRGFGRILLFGGTRTDAIRGFKHNAAYAAAKTGLGVLNKSIAAEFAPQGVSCALLCPGFVETEYLSAAFKQELLQKSPSKQLIQEAEIALLAVQLLTGGMDLCNGAIINADGGLYSL